MQTSPVTARRYRWLAALLSPCAFAPAAGIYVIQSFPTSDTVVINRVEFRRLSPCRDLLLHDHIMFLEGDPFGNCVHAEILNLRNHEQCKLNCPVPRVPDNPQQQAASG